MKTEKKLLSKKTMIKITSCFLSFILTSNVGFSFLSENVFAADNIVVENNEVTLQSANGNLAVFYLMSDNGTYFITTSFEDPKPEATIPNHQSFVIGDNCKLVTYTDYSFNKIQLTATGSRTSADLELQGDYNISWNSLSGYGNNHIKNYATLNYSSEFSIYDLHVSNGSSFSFNNYGVINASDVSIDTYGFGSSSDSEIHVTDSFTFSTDGNLNSTVIVNSGTVIDKSGGENQGDIHLRLGDSIKDISGTIVSASAIDLFDDPTITLDSISNVKHGEDYDFSNKIHTATGYTGTRIFDSHSPVTSIWFRTKHLNVSAKIKKSRLYAIFFQKYDCTVSCVAFPDCAKIQLHAGRAGKNGSGGLACFIVISLQNGIERRCRL